MIRDNILVCVVWNGDVNRQWWVKRGGGGGGGWGGKDHLKGRVSSNPICYILNNLSGSNMQLAEPIVDFK